MARYRLENIDPDRWRDFKALCALEGKSIRQKLIDFINSQAESFRSTQTKKEFFEYWIKTGKKR